MNPQMIHPPAPATFTPQIHQDGNEEATRCSSCGSTQPFFTDFSQGDVVCTFCGVVQHERLLDTAPEWREYADDLSSGIANKARCGMAPNDESSFFGGLEPTRLSSLPFGDSTSNALRQTLHRVHHRTDDFVRKGEKRAWKSAEVAVAISKKKMANKKQKVESRDKKAEYDTNTDTDLEERRPDFDLVVVDDDDDDDHVQTELAEQVLQLEAKRRQLRSQKWSLERALAGDGIPPSLEKHKKMTKKEREGLRKASEGLLEAYEFLKKEAESLPGSYLDNAAKRLEAYATQRDGLPKDKSALAAALLGRCKSASLKAYNKIVKDLQKYNLFRASSAEDWIRPLDLPSTAAAVVLNLIQKKASANKAYNAALVYLICTAGARSQHWAGTASNTTITWDAWREELPWSRSPPSIAKAFDISIHQLRQQYSALVFPERLALLEVAATTETPLKNVLLPQLAAASATLKSSDFDTDATKK